MSPPAPHKYSIQQPCQVNCRNAHEHWPSKLVGSGKDDGRPVRQQFEQILEGSLNGREATTMGFFDVLSCQWLANIPLSHARCVIPDLLDD